MKSLRFAIFGNIYQEKKSASISMILSHLRRHGADISIEKEFLSFLIRESRLSGAELSGVRSFEGSDFAADYVISMGGDGTLLKAAMHVGDKQTPIIGVNMGRLGFLAGITPDEIEGALDDIYMGVVGVGRPQRCDVGAYPCDRPPREYAPQRLHSPCAGDHEGAPLQTDDHVVIAVKPVGGTLTGYPCALNDIAVLKRDNASMITIHVAIDGNYLATYRADGLIISTPTGSTAYSLSNGGPIIVPSTGVFCLTPVAPHSLNIRPVVVPDTATVTLSVESRSHNYLVAIDGRSEKCAESTELEISKADYCVRTIRRSDMKYISTLREKMMWGADNRM